MIFHKFESWIRKNYWSPFGMDESCFNKEVDRKNQIHYNNDQVDLMWRGFKAGYKISSNNKRGNKK